MLTPGFIQALGIQTLFPTVILSKATGNPSYFDRYEPCPHSLVWSPSPHSSPITILRAGLMCANLPRCKKSPISRCDCQSKQLPPPMWECSCITASFPISMCLPSIMALSRIIDLSPILRYSDMLIRTLFPIFTPSPLIIVGFIFRLAFLLRLRTFERIYRLRIYYRV